MTTKQLVEFWYGYQQSELWIWYLVFIENLQIKKHKWEIQRKYMDYTILAVRTEGLTVVFIDDSLLTSINQNKMTYFETHYFLQQGKSEVYDSYNRPSNLAQIGSKYNFFGLCEIKIWRMTLKTNREPLPCP